MRAEPHEGLPSSNHAAIQAAAVAWLCEREEGFTPERATAFADWCSADPRHRAAVVKVERGLDLLQALPAARPLVESRVGPQGRRAAPAPSRGDFSGWAWPAGLAAAALLAVVFWRLPLPPRGDTPTVVSSTSAPARAVLGDGSIVNVNTQSKVEVKLAAAERRVTLELGEAHFEVKPDAARPFVVVAGGVTVRALGTMFSVRMAGDEVEVLVEEGKVAVTPGNLPAAPTSLGQAIPVVQAGERALVPRLNATGTVKVEKMNPPAMAAGLQWHRRMAFFNETPLYEVITQFNRRNTVQLVLADVDLGARRFGGALALDEVDALLRLLVREGGVAIEHRGTDEILLRRAP